MTVAGTWTGDQIIKAASCVLCMVATVWIAWTLAGMVWLVSGHDNAPLNAPSHVAQRTAAPVDVSRLAALNLFGQPPVATTVKGAVANAPDTSLQLRLAGVFVNADPARSSAIVGERNNGAAPAKVYRLNDSLPGGATLAEVYDDRILIQRSGGNSEVLRFEKTNLLSGKPPTATTLSTPASANTLTPVNQLLNNALQSLAASPEQFMRQMGLKSGGPNGGYEVTTATPDNVRTAVGLQPGDRIMSVNGQRLGDPVRDREVLTALRGGNSAKVEIQRGGQIVTLERKF